MTNASPAGRIPIIADANLGTGIRNLSQWQLTSPDQILVSAACRSSEILVLLGPATPSQVVFRNGHNRYFLVAMTFSIFG